MLPGGNSLGSDLVCGDDMPGERKTVSKRNTHFVFQEQSNEADCQSAQISGTWIQIAARRAAIIYKTLGNAFRFLDKFRGVD